MARLIQKSGYFKGGSGVGYMRYVAQREGVEITSNTGPVTQMPWHPAVRHREHIRK